MISPSSFRRAILYGCLALFSPSALLGQPASTLQTEPEQERLLGPEKMIFRSEVLGEERTILVRLPEGYEQSTRKYPVLYVLDGEYFFQQAVSAVQFLSELGYDASQHPIPELIVVGVVNVDRDRDYTPTHAPEQSQGRLSFPTSGAAEDFQVFLEREVFPLVESRYRASPDRTLSGWSLGGLFTVYTFLDHPSLFSRYLAISPSLWWDDSVVVKATRERLASGDSLSPKPLVITLGALEGGDMDGSVRKLFAPLLSNQGPANLDFTFREIPDEVHGYVPYKAYYDGLSAAFADWVVPAEVLQQGLEAVEKFFDELAERYGHTVDVPLSVYRLLSVTLPDIEPALQVAREAVTKYPYSSAAHLALGRLQQMAGDVDAARESLRIALQLEIERPIPQSENLKAIRARLQALEAG
jgi:predicted alpha/beta superfamily hydrolase